MAAIPEAVSNSISSKQRIGLKLYSCGQTALNRLPTQLPGVHSKPNCSYNCLIGMALKGSKRKCLPVNEIYTFFLNEFPYFRNSAPDGWKNSIRHSLSLGPYFRKTQVAGFQGKKGFQWEVIPDKLPALEQEIAKYLAEEEKLPHQFGIEPPTPTSHRYSQDIARMRIMSLTSHDHSVTADSSFEKLKLQCKKFEPSIPPKEEIVGILAYLKDGAPQAARSAGLTTATDSVSNSQNISSAKAGNDTNTTSLRLPITDKPPQALTHGDSSPQQDLGEWLNLELVNDVDTDSAELHSPLTADCLGMKQSLNWSTHAYENEEKPCKSRAYKQCHIDIKLQQKECLTSHIGDDWLEPANDWNQWNEPAYVERMINLSSSLQSYTSLNNHAITTEMATANCMSITGKHYGNKINKCVGRSNYISKVSKGAKHYTNRKKPVSDKKICASKVAASSQKTSQSNISMEKCTCCTCYTDKATSGHLERNGKCLTSPQLIVSISFEHLDTVKYQKNQHPLPSREQLIPSNIENNKL